MKSHTHGPQDPQRADPAQDSPLQWRLLTTRGLQARVRRMGWGAGGQGWLFGALLPGPQQELVGSSAVGAGAAGTLLCTFWDISVFHPIPKWVLVIAPGTRGRRQTLWASLPHCPSSGAPCASGRSAAPSTPPACELPCSGLGSSRTPLSSALQATSGPRGQGSSSSLSDHLPRVASDRHLTLSTVSLGVLWGPAGKCPGAGDRREGAGGTCWGLQAWLEEAGRLAGGWGTSEAVPRAPSRARKGGWGVHQAGWHSWKGWGGRGTG